jgi:hypothetical protein
MGRQIWEVIDVGKFWMLGRSQNLGGGRLGGLEGRMDRQDDLAGVKCIFATSCRLCVIIPLITAQKDLSTTILFLMYKYILILCIEVVPRGMCQASRGFSLSKKYRYMSKHLFKR